MSMILKNGQVSRMKIWSCGVYSQSGDERNDANDDYTEEVEEDLGRLRGLVSKPLEPAKRLFSPLPRTSLPAS